MKNVLLLKDGDNWKVYPNDGNCNLSFNNIIDAINCWIRFSLSDEEVDSLISILTQSSNNDFDLTINKKCPCCNSSLLAVPNMMFILSELRCGYCHYSESLSENTDDEQIKRIILNQKKIVRQMLNPSNHDNIKQRRELLGLETLTPEQLKVKTKVYAKKNDDLETIKKAMSYQNDMMKQILDAVTIIKDSVVNEKDTKEDEVEDHRIKELREHSERLLRLWYPHYKGVL